MSNVIEVKVPDIGDFDSVEIIEILVAEGDEINVEEALITVESDKASMEIPSSDAGTVKTIKVAMGDKVSQGSVIIELEAAQKIQADASEDKPAQEESSSANTADETASIPDAAQFDGTADIQAQVVVLGSGPGGYTAAFRAADLGKQVVLIEKDDYLGGVCLNVGCIPSKALLHVAEVVNEAREFSKLGVTYQEPEIDTDKLREHKNKVVGRLTGGLKQLAKQRKVQIVNGYGKFTSANSIEVEAADGSKQTVAFENCIIAAGSSVTRLPFIPWEDERVWDSTDALELKNIPERLLVVGGGIIGLEMATVYHALGAQVTVVELGPGLIPGADRDLLKPFERTLKRRYENIFVNTKVTTLTPTDEGIVCQFEGKKAPEQDTFDNVLVAIGRSPNGKLVDADKAGVIVNEYGFIPVDTQQRTNVNHIFAIGDVVGQPMLAHKATHEAKVAAEVIDGQQRYFDARTIPSVAYTEPEVAWCGQTEEQLKAEGIEYEKGVFPWAASGRALSVGVDVGMTKVLYDKATHRMLGTGILGKNAGELIAEAALAVEMGAEMEDVALTIHPHPTLSETINFATEVAEGTCTDIYLPKK
ncbi:MAG: dihydrolipoyl dehydrogenase [gamma proteobacterium symbiont of Bathyaustriella thionipta]|nr:dihydrolipoyl dehydrogenase [gamma proteobacterium symbiont of Bathyaustriella thionipta]MCU7950444.1 dihydrolipoyl dehydrogenase [gamma proteobacterium symbiont of Bathyaustriella thionipta]MCU7954722.1 dihydrolipoyl dehydrogenase [gamma proteobacterium symbiont of Bathyaustriella thionipta]MCU7956962.1 dihydrolipoyl dehydrogenase [gamma proteobacterium symbiont of Bathyaustriella thionipta]